MVQALSGHFTDYKDLIRQLGGIFIIVFGLIIVGVFKPKFLMQDRKFTFKNRPSGYFGSVLIGLAFAAGWTPCTGPILVSVIGLANEPRVCNDLYDCIHTWILSHSSYYHSLLRKCLGLKEIV